MAINAVPISVEVREKTGKGATQILKKSGRVPGVIYGNEITPVHVSLDQIDLKKQLQQPGFFSRIFEIETAGTKHQVLARDLKLDPVSDRPIHIDFMRFSKRTVLTIDISVKFKNDSESPGLKRGGVLNVVRHTVELRCRPDVIPDILEADLSGLEIGDSIHISAINLPEGVTPVISDRDFTIATIAAPTIVIEETAEDVEEGDPDADEVSAESATETKENQSESS